MYQIYPYIFAFLTTLLAIWLLTPFALHVGLVDEPSVRKKHTGAIPLIGGLAMFLAFTLTLLTLDVDILELRSLIFSALILVVVGVLDDHREVGVYLRFGVQIFAVLIMTSTAGHAVVNLGDLMGAGEIELGGWAIPFTVIAVVGGMNALNMSDGIDGLAGGLSLICFSSMFYLALDGGLLSESKVILVLMSTLIAFLLFNLPLFGRKSAAIFMGDTGSMFLGFCLGWYFAVLCQGEHAVMTPATTLWIFAVPTLDTVSIMLRRILKRQSPFQPDREHFHHVFQAAGFSSLKTLIIILIFQLIMTTIGIAGYKYGVPEWIMFWGFMIIFAIFFWAMKRAWRIMRVLRKYGGEPKGDVA